MKVSLQSYNSSPTFDSQNIKHYYKPFQTLVHLYKHYFKNHKLYKLVLSHSGRNKHATTHIAKVDTRFSSKHGVIPEGHCQPGTDPIPRTSQTEQRLAMLDYPRGSQRSYLKNRLARLRILILSKT
jgi:hypothetical protein